MEVKKWARHSECVEAGRQRCVQDIASVWGQGENKDVCKTSTASTLVKND